MINKTFLPLEAERITNNLKKHILDYLPEIFISDKTASTNDDAKEYLLIQPAELSVHLAEQQEAGKGRNGKKWISPKGKNIYLSLGWKSPLQYSELDGLSLSVGSILATVLNKKANNSIKIKWPNDLMINQKKISGILIETIEIEGQVGIVIGIGINVHMSQEDGKDIDQSWVALDEASRDINDRNLLVAMLLNELFKLIKIFPKEGFKAFKSEFESLDLLNGKVCKVTSDDTDKVVEVIGVSDSGELLVKENSEYLTLRYGEVSIRAL
jgi:BirA family biotin operon repressor/biotin-[acetyl-CoA-carboxylase] ligase